MCDGEWQRDQAAHAVSDQEDVRGGPLLSARGQDRVEVCHIVGEAHDAGATAARPAVTAVVGGTNRITGDTETLGNACIPATVLRKAVRYHHDTHGVGGGQPRLVIDGNAPFSGEPPLLVAKRRRTHRRSVAGPRYSPERGCPTFSRSTT